MTSEPNPTNPHPYGLTEEQRKMLFLGLTPGRVHRDDAGHSHVQAWDDRRWMNRIFGFGGWSTRETSLTLIHERFHENKDGRDSVTVIYRCSVVLEVKDIHGNILGEYHGSAVGQAPSFPTWKIADAHDMAIKTADSQAFKRACVNLGDTFGLSLYNKGSEDPQVQNSVAYGPLVPIEDEPVGLPEDETAEAVRQIALQEAAAEQTGRGEQRQRSTDTPAARPPMGRDEMQLAGVGANTTIPRKGPDAGPRPQAATPNGRARAIVWDVDNVLRNLDDCTEALECIHTIREKAKANNLGNDVVRVPDRLLDDEAVDKSGAPFSHTHQVHEIIDAAGLLIRRLCEASQPNDERRDITDAELMYAAQHGPDRVQAEAFDELDRRVRQRDGRTRG